jgi:FkbM family methyltransferase
MISRYVQLLHERKFQPETILEIGSRDGHDANFMKSYFGIENENVYVVEPNPIMARTISVTYPNFNVFECAISLEKGVAHFNQVVTNNPDLNGVSSLLDRHDSFYADHRTMKIEVQTITGKDLMKHIKMPIDICKIDVEGLTYEVLQSFGDTLQMIKSFHLETEHIEVWKGQKLHNDVCVYMIEAGYVMIGENRAYSVQSDSIWVKNTID